MKSISNWIIINHLKSSSKWVNYKNCMKNIFDTEISTFFSNQFYKKKPLILFVSRKSRRRLNHLYRRHVNWYNSVTQPSQMPEMILNVLPNQMKKATAIAIMRKSLCFSEYLLGWMKYVNMIGLSAIVHNLRLFFFN